MFKTSAIGSNRWLAGSCARKLLIAFILCAFALMPFAQAQTTGSLGGTVRDTTGAVVPGATVTLINADSKAQRSTTSNSEGFFSINAIQPATYNVVVAARGFDTLKVSGIEVHPGDHQTIQNLGLKIGAVEIQVEVSATAAGINLSSPEKSALITAEDIKRLSTVGRDATELIKFLPGFAASTGGNLSNISANNGSQTMGFGTSSVSSFSANGATPQTGATSVVSDGNNVMDPGDMGASIANVNMDMVQEIKVQTSNFGADSAKGPVVINAVGKSGGSNYHGSVYLFARNGVLNANEWQSNYNGVARPDSKYFFPGGNVGGPVRIPGTDFNRSKKLTFFTGFEYYKQTTFDGLLLSFIPTPRMMTGDLTPASIGEALNVPVDVLTKQCPNFYTSGTLANSGGVCYSPGFGSSSTYTQQDCLIVAGQIVGSPGNGPLCNVGGFLPQDRLSRANIYAKFWPKANRVPVAGNGLASDGYNYQNALTSTHNGYQYHARIDNNFSDNTKLYVTYNFEKINDESPLDNTFYAGNDPIPYPTSAFSNTKSNSLSLNFTKVFGSTLTNELVAAGTYYYQPNQLADRNLVSDASTGWSGGRYYGNNGALQLPGIRDYESGVPGFAMGYFPAGSAFLRKVSYNGGDNLTKQLGTHSIKVGVYAELTANNQVPYNFTQGLNTFNHYNYGCATDVPGAHTSQLQNGIANFLQGCSEFSQASASTPADMNFKTIGFFATDEWKATKKLTLTYGLRFDHLGPWTDAHGIGLAVWNAPQKYLPPADVSGGPRTYPGISWHQTDSSVPLSGSPSTALFYSPRVGLAYDMYGEGKTVFRGGWGAYRFHDSYNDSAGPLSTSQGIQTFDLTRGGPSCTYDQLAGYQGQSCNAVATSFSIYALDPHDKEQPVTYNYNFTVDQAMPFNSSLELSYVGNQSQHTFTAGNLSNQNYIPLGGLFQPDPITHAVTQPGSSQQIQQDYRPYPNYTSVFVPNHIGYGNYNALQASWNKQKGSFIYGVNYTWSKALGIRGDYRTGAVGDPSTLRNNYGYLGFNRSQIVNFTYSWQVGNLYQGNRFLRAAINQWEFSGITGIQSGPDISVLTGNGNFGLAGGIQYTAPGTTTPTNVSLSNSTVLGTPDINLQPVVTCSPKSNLHDNATYGRQYINSSCFALPSLGKNGNFELPDIHGPAYFNSDLTVQRTFKLKEKQNVQFRLAGFNFLNHPLPSFQNGSNQVGLTLNYGSPDSSATTPAQAIARATQNSVNFGYTPFKQGFRIVELGARYSF